MLITPPTDEERAVIKLRQAHRFPELFYFPKPGDDGRPVKVPVILGNPSGASKMPDGMRPSKAWSKAVAATFGKASEYDYGPLIQDCVLWPAPVTWAQWCERWPAMSDSVRPALVRKYGGAQSLVTEPGPEEVCAPEIAEALAAHPGSTWMRFAPKGSVIDLVVRAPGASKWALFTDAAKERDAEYWALASDLATDAVVASTRPFAEAAARWPGFVLLVDHEVSHLAGLATEYQEGEL